MQALCSPQVGHHAIHIDLEGCEADSAQPTSRPLAGRPSRCEQPRSIAHRARERLDKPTPAGHRTNAGKILTGAASSSFLDCPPSPVMGR
jgi:hypothetical protein